MVNVDDGTDYRQRTLEQVELYHMPAGRRGRRRRWQTAFERSPRRATRDPVLHIEHRELRARRRAGGVVWFDFKQLCGGPRSQNDYLEIATQFHTVLLSRRAADVAAPGLARRGASPGWSTCCTTGASS